MDWPSSFHHRWNQPSRKDYTTTNLHPVTVFVSSMIVTNDGDVTYLVDGERMESEAKSMLSNCVSVVESIWSEPVFTRLSVMASHWRGQSAIHFSFSHLISFFYLFFWKIKANPHGTIWFVQRHMPFPPQRHWSAPRSMYMFNANIK